VQQAREPTCHAGGADVVGDVARESLCGQAERTVFGRQRIAGVIADQQEPVVGSPFDSFNRLEFGHGPGITGSRAPLQA